MSAAFSGEMEVCVARRDRNNSVEPIVGIVVGLAFLASAAKSNIMGVLGTALLIAAIVASIGAAVYYLFFRRSAPYASDNKFRPTRLAPVPALPPRRYSPPPPIDDPFVVDFESPSNNIEPPPIAPLRWNMDLLRNLEWKQFETVCTAYLAMTGYEAKETRIGADGGVDIRIHKPGDPDSTALVQCKSWNTYKVGIKPVRELYGVMAAEGASRGIFMTSASFTSEAEGFARGKIDLIDGATLLNSILELTNEQQQRLLKIATEGDYMTPTCPQCGVKMVTRTSKSGQNSGNPFWGCPRYPRCRQTLAAPRG